LAEIKLTINGKEVKGETGDNILDVCEKSGIDVPTLCHYKGLTDIGACRMCIVEIGEERVVIEAACTSMARGGIVVKTDTKRLYDLRRINLELLLSERNHFCMFCEMSGDCELQDLAYQFKIDHIRYPLLFPKLPVDASHKYMVIDHNRCILCGRCIRFCDEIEVSNTLDFRERGSRKMLNIDLNNPFGESTCTSCGGCIQVCPTGAVFDKRSSYIGRSEECKFTKTICAECRVGCGIEVVTKSNQILRINGDFDSEVNRGLICDKGRFAPLYERRKRYLKPMIRKNGELKESNWEESSKLIVEKLGRIDGKDIMGLISARITTENISLFKKFINNLCNSENIGMLHGPITDIVGEGLLDGILKSDLIIVLGAEFTKYHKVIRSLIKRAVVSGSRLILIDSKDEILFTIAEETFTTKKLEKVDEEIYKVRKISIIFNYKISEDVEKWLLKYDGKLNLIGLMPGPNSLGSFKMGIKRDFKPIKAKGLFIMAEDETDDILEGIVDIAKQSELFVLQTSYENILSKEADIIIPAFIWAERYGTYINLEGREQKLNQSIKPPSEILECWEMLIDLAEKMRKFVY